MRLRVKDKRYKKGPPGPGPVPDSIRCHAKDEKSFMPQCPREADWVIDHDEFMEDPDDPKTWNFPLACDAHLHTILASLIEPDCGMDELTLHRRRHTHGR